jgi:hypothetical protein
MSNKRQQRRAKQVRRTNVRSAQRAKRPPTPGEVALRLIRDFAVPLASRDPLDAELVASALMGTGWKQVLTLPAEEATDLPHPALAVISLMRNLRVEQGELADAALALAHALCVADREDPQVAAAGGVLVEQLRAAGAQDPIWAGETGRYELVAAHDVRDAWMDEHQLVLGFRDESGREHGVLITIDRTEGMQFAQLEIIDRREQMLADVADSIAKSDDPDLAVVEELSPARAGGLLQAAIEGSFEEGGDLLQVSDQDELDLLQLVLARFELFEAAVEDATEEANATPFDSEFDEVPFDELVTRFTSSEEFAAEPEATPRSTELLLRWVHDIAYPRALFGPVQVQDVLLDHVPRRVTDTDERATIAGPMVATVRAWSRFCARVVGLGDAVLADALQAIEHYAPQHEQAMTADPGSLLGSGHVGEDLNKLVAQMTEQMRVAGVDLGDPVAVREWMTANAPV